MYSRTDNLIMATLKSMEISKIDNDNKRWTDFGGGAGGADGFKRASHYRKIGKIAANRNYWPYWRILK